MTIFGNDFNTNDGTCVRDYIHVSDLADAHVLALEHISRNETSVTYNLGNGGGFSNLEIIESARRVTGRRINYEIGARRGGDPDRLVASSDKIIGELGWKPQFADLDKIMETAYVWHKNNPNGYKE